MTQKTESTDIYKEYFNSSPRNRVNATIMLSSEKDTSFCFPVPDILESDGVKLVPFIPAKIASTLFQGLTTTPSLLQFLSIGPYTSAEELVLDFWDNRLKPNPAATLFVIYDKTQPNPDTEAAGFIALIYTSAPDLLTEIGYVVIFKAYQRTHVSSNAVGLLMRYALDLPDQGGLGLRRVQWKANKWNEASLALALKMGFVKEGMMRWCTVINKGNGKEVGNNGERERKGDPREGCGSRDTVILAVCWG
ncbi:hypothetical protein VNI00_006540 [Paramarasmius palmivorus]|uniref:N-acetyltransferase domain-containing protein n=1 Tax=Paramarasmius palmivorus TaxID=297713 RepID=A0AAW0D9C5_9AGAR